MSEILTNWMDGRGCPDVLVIDGHIHIGEGPEATALETIERTATESVAFMDANGVDAICVQSGGYLGEGADYRLGNDFLLGVCRRVPERFIGFAGVNPNDTREYTLAELDRVFDAGIRGIKLINTCQENYPGDGPNLMAAYEYATEHNMLVFNHIWVPDVLMRISAQFPDTDFICGHYWNVYDPVLKERKNVYANIWNLETFGWLDRGIENVGAEKFMMGSDGFMNPISVGIGPVVFAPISDYEKRLILGLTVARLLDKVGALPSALKRKYPC